MCALPLFKSLLACCRQSNLLLREDEKGTLALRWTASNINFPIKATSRSSFRCVAFEDQVKALVRRSIQHAATVPHPHSLFFLFVELYFVFLLNKTPHECGGSRLVSGSIVPLIGRRSPELIMRSRLNNKPGSFSLASMLFISGEYVTRSGKRERS